MGNVSPQGKHCLSQSLALCRDGDTTPKAIRAARLTALTTKQSNSERIRARPDEPGRLGRVQGSGAGRLHRKVLQLGGEAHRHPGVQRGSLSGVVLAED